MEKQFIVTLIKVGNSNTIDNDSEQILKNTDINYCENWTEIITKLKTDELIGVFKGIVIAEKHFHWRHGSAATGVWLYREITKRKIDTDLKIANWAFLYTDNGYIPFGSDGNIRHKSKDAYDYIRNSESLLFYELSDYAIDRINNSSSYLDSRKIDELNVENKSLRRKISELEETISKIQFEKDRLKKRLELTKKPSLEKAQIIIHDTGSPVYLYSEEIEQILFDKDLPIDLLKEILLKFKDNENKHNTILKNKIINEINNR
jgi:hypothetical protein